MQGVDAFDAFHGVVMASEFSAEVWRIAGGRTVPLSALLLAIAAAPRKSRMPSSLRSGASLRQASLLAGSGHVDRLLRCKRESAETAVEPTAATAATDAPAALAKAAEAVNPLPSAKDQVDEVMDRFLAATQLPRHHDRDGSEGQTSNGTMTMEMDFVAPDRYRMKAPMGTQYVIGDTMYMTMERPHDEDADARAA